MQVISNYSIHKIGFLNSKSNTNTTQFSSKPEKISMQSIPFTGAPVITKTVTSQIAHEKSKLLKQIRDILATEAPILSAEEKLFAKLKKALSILEMTKKRGKEIEQEIEFLLNSPFLNPQQKLNRAQELKKEFSRICKIKITEPEQKQPSKDNYDYALINKFKTAILNDNFDLAKIQEEHYRNLAEIKTAEEFKEKYPSIRIPANAKEVIIKKILDTLNQKFYLDLDALFDTGDEDTITYCLFNYFEDYFKKLAPQFENKKNSDDLLNLLGIELSRKVLETYEELKMSENFDKIPKFRKNSLAIISENDKEFLDINYDSFLIQNLRKIYLEGKKINEIEYVEGNKKIKLSSINSPEYKFEKIPEKIKRLLSETQKAQKLQRDYLRFTEDELKTRLAYYAGFEFINNDEILNTYINFDSCKFTEEDKQYLIKFLQILDNIADKKISLEEAVDIIHKNNINPHGTNKLNEIERKELEEKFKQEQQKILAHSQLKEDFNKIINTLYEKNLSSIAERLSKYYPEIIDIEVINKTKDIIKSITQFLALEDSNKIKNNIIRWEIFNDYKNISENSEKFQQALEYANLFGTKDLEQRGGQYLLNREIIENYPQSAKLAPNPKILEKIIEKFGQDQNLATIYLCKYEDFNSLPKSEKVFISTILKFFDIKNPNDKIILKEIIEKEYINSDTIFKQVDKKQTLETSITTKAKRKIFSKYDFPGSIYFFTEFEDAMKKIASERGSAGIKKTGSNNNALEHKMELKIIGCPDRLFSSKNNYKFDIYSEKGLHH